MKIFLVIYLAIFGFLGCGGKPEKINPAMLMAGKASQRVYQVNTSSGTEIARAFIWKIFEGVAYADVLPEKYHTAEFNADGTIGIIHEFMSNGTPANDYVYEYENGRKVKRHDLNPLTQVEVRYKQWYYDAEGRLTQIDNKEADRPTVSYKYFFLYDANGEVYRVNLWDNIGNVLQAYWLYEHDANGNNTKIERYTSTGTKVYTKVYEYDSNNLVTRESISDALGATEYTIFSWGTGDAGIQLIQKERHADLQTAERIITTTYDYRMEPGVAQNNMWFDAFILEDSEAYPL